MIYLGWILISGDLWRFFRKLGDLATPKWKLGKQSIFELIGLLVGGFNPLEKILVKMGIVLKYG